MAGIKAVDGAVLKIIDNDIKLNFAQGILLVESSYAHIECNRIS